VTDHAHLTIRFAVILLDLPISSEKATGLSTNDAIKVGRPTGSKNLTSTAATLREAFFIRHQSHIDPLLVRCSGIIFWCLDYHRSTFCHKLKWLHKSRLPRPHLMIANLLYVEHLDTFGMKSIQRKILICSSYYRVGSKLKTELLITG
jgi:hypothetical protein